MKAVWKSVVLVVLVAMGAVIWRLYTWQPGPPYPGDPTKGGNMLFKDINPEPTPRRVQVFSTLKEGDKDQMNFVSKQPKKWLRLETRNEVAIASLVEAMREGAGKVLYPPLKDVVTYHIYFESSESKLPLYYIFYYQTKTNEPSALTAYTTSGNLCNAEAVERWFETNGLLRVTGKE